MVRDASIGAYLADFGRASLLAISVPSILLQRCFGDGLVLPVRQRQDVKEARLLDRPREAEVPRAQDDGR